MKSMGRIFIGLVKCGAWGCFDEFNRLEEAVLSAVSMQIQTIQATLKSRKPSCELLERTVSHSDCVVYVTRIMKLLCELIERTLSHSDFAVYVTWVLEAVV